VFDLVLVIFDKKRLFSSSFKYIIVGADNDIGKIDKLGIDFLRLKNYNFNIK